MGEARGEGADGGELLGAEELARLHLDLRAHGRVHGFEGVAHAVEVADEAAELAVAAFVDAVVQARLGEEGDGGVQGAERFGDRAVLDEADGDGKEERGGEDGEDELEDEAEAGGGGGAGGEDFGLLGGGE